MGTLHINQILIKDAKLESPKLNISDQKIINLIEDTKQRQAEVLKLKEVDKEMLRTVVQV